MYPTVIPNKISFIWVGPSLPERYGVNIFTWAEANPQYEVYLWTEQFNIHTNAKLIVDAYLHSVDSDPASQISIYDTFDGVMVNITMSGRSPVQIFVNSIGLLTPLLDPSLLMEELTVWKNYGTTSDILRFWVVNHIGGIYMDLDTFMKVISPLPLNIYAPRGILFAEVLDGHKLTMATPIVASSQGHLTLRKISLAIEQTYNKEYPQVGHGAREFAEQNQQRLQAVIDLRRTMKREIAEQGKVSIFTDAEFGLFFVASTLSRGGGWMHHIDPREVNDAVVLEYSFQEQADYEVIIDNDSTWKK